MPMGKLREAKKRVLDRVEREQVSPASDGYNFIDNETMREGAYCAVAQSLAHIYDADMTVCQNVVDSVFAAIKSVSKKL